MLFDTPNSRKTRKKGIKLVANPCPHRARDCGDEREHDQGARCEQVIQEADREGDEEAGNAQARVKHPDFAAGEVKMVL